MMKTLLRHGLLGRLHLALLLALMPLMTTAARAAEEPTPILPIDQVRVGMKGYGLTVFHGTEIEPFPIEVISVQYDFAPKRGVIWIRCPDERMQQSGPVQGMSGSPIFLWDKGEDQEMGQGGKLIGAFAYGYQFSKDCLVGVQPIELMRDVAQRAQADQPEEEAAGPEISAGINDTLPTLLALADRMGPDTHGAWRVEALTRLIGQDKQGMDVEARRAWAEPSSLLDGPPGVPGQVTALSLPVTVGSPAAARLLTPLLRPMGMTAVSSAIGNSLGQAPPEYNTQNLRLEPGSVLAVPLAWGDLDISASGTVTDVLPDGTVLGFGHAMMGEGKAQFPMATGFVHTVMPSIATSFKLGGSAAVQGTLVRDENAAVIGAPAQTFTTAPVKVTVEALGQPQREYNYQVVQHKRLTPSLAAMTAAQSLVSVQGLTAENTTRISGTLKFEGDREIAIDQLVPQANTFGVLMALAPPTASLAINPYESIMLTSMDLKLEVSEGIQLAVLSKARLDEAVVAPGDTLNITVQLSPYGKRPETRRIDFALPAGLPDGDYQVTISDAPTYLRYLMRSRPHLLTPADADGFFSVVKRITTTPENAIYVMLHLHEQGLAVGQEELGRLPSSRKAMLLQPTTSTITTTFMETIDKRVMTDEVIRGEVGFTLSVRSDLPR